MTNSATEFTVHQFRDSVAINTPNGTFYLTADNALLLGMRLEQHALHTDAGTKWSLPKCEEIACSTTYPPVNP